MWIAHLVVSLGQEHSFQVEESWMTRRPLNALKCFEPKVLVDSET